MARLIRSTGDVPAWRRQLEQAHARVEQQRQQTSGPSRVMLVIDCSGSMEGDKLEQARAGALSFADQALAIGYRVGLISFGSEAKTLASPGTDMMVLRAAVAGLRIIGSTNLSAALRLGVKELGPEAGQKALCLVTDGAPDDCHTALMEAGAARTQQVDIIAIGTDDANRRYLEMLATRASLARKVERTVLRQGISEMALLLPKPR